MPKSSVSKLQECCYKQKMSAPTYEYVDSVGGGFDCKIEVDGILDVGTGRSKRDAKHQAASNMLKRMHFSTAGNEDLTYQPVDKLDVDMVVKLRDYCLRKMFPLPVFDIVQQAGTPDSPIFTGVCSVASIKRYGQSQNKKCARQKAAGEVYRIIIDNDAKFEQFEQQFKVASLDARAKQIEAARYLKFKNYYDFIKSGSKGVPGVRLCDRHNYFCKFYAELKNEAKRILNETYESSETQALEVLRALKLTPTISYMSSANTPERMAMIELDCEYDVVFLNVLSKVYKEIVDYFKVMLY